MSTSQTNFLGLPFGQGGSGTSLSDAQANILAGSTAQVQRLNADLVLRYHMFFADYTQNMQSGGFVPEDRRVPPKPPHAWELAPPNQDGFVFYQISQTTLVCDQPPTPSYNAGNPQPNTVPNMIMLGVAIPGGGGKWFQALKGDTFPNGMTTPPQPDGHTYEKFGAPVGPGWYLQVG